MTQPKMFQLNVVVANLSDVIEALVSDGHDRNEVLEGVNTLCTFGDADRTLLATHKVCDEFGVGSGSQAGALLDGVDYVDFEH